MTKPEAKLDAQLIARRFAGVALGGGKADRTSVATLEAFPKQKRLFLRSLRDRVKGDSEASADDALFEILARELQEPLEMIGIDAPLQLPICMRCELACPGVERCVLPEMKWMRDQHRKKTKDKKPVKMFTPYTERPAEMYLSSELEEVFHPSHALGANAAPLAARARFLIRRLKTPAIEVYPKAAIWRIGRSLGIQKSYLRYHRHAVEGDEARLAILRAIVEAGIVFVYQQDLKTMVENNQAFEAFVTALTTYLKDRGQTDSRPLNYPSGEAWIETPKAQIVWF